MADIDIRPADLEADRDLLVGLLLEHLSPRSTVRRFDWFYRDNPHGPASAWIATVAGEGEIIGSGAIIPRDVYVDGEVRRAAVMADFWIHPRHRSLGPAIKLQRACVEGAAMLGFAFFDLPQANMSAVYQRMRLLGDNALTGLVKPVGCEPYVRKIARNSAVSRLLAPLGDIVLKLGDQLRARASGCEFALLPGEFGAEFSQLARCASRQHRVCVARSAEYLQWRYRRHYYLSYDIFTARRGGKLCAYAAVVDTGAYADVLDLFGEFEPSVFADLLLYIAEYYRSKGSARLTLALHATEQWREMLESVGFRQRQAKPLVIHEFERAPGTGGLSRTGAAGWFLSYGDIDY